MSRWIRRAHGVSIVLVICDVLVPHGVEDITNYHRLHMIEQYVEPHCDEGNGQAVSDKENRFVFQSIANRDSGDGEACVGEDHGPPTQVEVDSPRVDNLMEDVSGASLGRGSQFYLRRRERS